jgi:hypothetical protein
MWKNRMERVTLRYQHNITLFCRNMDQKSFFLKISHQSLINNQNICTSMEFYNQQDI